jgi:hypothetical protein
LRVKLVVFGTLGAGEIAICHKILTIYRIQALFSSGLGVVRFMAMLIPCALLSDMLK